MAMGAPSSSCRRSGPSRASAARPAIQVRPQSPAAALASGQPCSGQAVGHSLRRQARFRSRMEPAVPLDGHSGKENLAASSQRSPRCRASPAASPACSDGSGASRKRGSLAQPPAAARPLSSPLTDPPATRRRPGGSPSASPPPADERETSAEAAARRQLAALASPSRPCSGDAGQEVRARGRHCLMVALLSCWALGCLPAAAHQAPAD